MPQKPGFGIHPTDPLEHWPALADVDSEQLL